VKGIDMAKDCGKLGRFIAAPNLDDATGGVHLDEMNDVVVAVLDRFKIDRDDVVGIEIGVPDSNEPEARFE
jgi:hypothetical protein